MTRYTRNNAPVVTVGIPTYNRARQLSRAIDSVRNQYHNTVEIIISDNASTDETPLVCNLAAAEDERIRVLRHTANMGATANFQAVAYASTGDYFMWLGDDDWIEPTFVSNCIDVLEHYPEVAVAAGRALFVDHDGRPVKEDVGLSLSSPSADRRVSTYFRHVFENSTFYGVVRRSHLSAVLPLEDRLGDDWRVVSTLAALGQVRSVPETRIVREMGGASANLGGIARQVDVGRFSRLAPYTSIALDMARHVSTHPAFRVIPPLRRRLLAAEVALIILARFWPRQWYRLLWLRWRRKFQSAPPPR